ncbi:TetR/AcrR family transcriptional regulator [Tatumella citrea]|uniref:TetR family transcriptional regulator n=1 Tax=Tatumella citrea TaxID=53336 RepID=A0A1Y0L864_TATCI|nr:TetR/AcrR family transcriptional regulator [Tatumella citrea]ARU94244.1 TetR family transcriptional regulator [Tatumella citrea]ARU98284.1 TetR family transcriptional regulator [Tatumella citrea]
MTKPSAARERILETAHQLFYRAGIRATGIDLIIREAAVTKVTFYRHFPSKNQLILEFLDYRHQRWMRWFTETLLDFHARGMPLSQAIGQTMAQWFNSDDFRGCAFTNTAAELGDSLPEALERVRQHKQDMTAAIASLLTAHAGAEAQAAMIAMAVDGAIVTAQRGDAVGPCVALLSELTHRVVSQ